MHRLLLAAAALLAFACLPHGAHAHGFLWEPQARNIITSPGAQHGPSIPGIGSQATLGRPALHWESHASAGGGFDVISNKRQGVTWPARAVAPGVCGDPSTANSLNFPSGMVPRAHEIGGNDAYTSYFTSATPRTYATGSIINVRFRITVFHMGRVGFQLCRHTGVDATEACFNQLPIVADQPQAVGSWFYVGGSPQSTGTPTDFSARLQLPAGVSCDGASAKCVLRWYYITGNSCTPANTPSQFANTALPVCGVNAGPANYPEEFWNCADIRITGGSTPTFCTGRSAGQYADSGCTGFWSCPANTRTTCPTGQLYSTTARACIIAANVDTATCTTRNTAPTFCTNRAAGLHADISSGCTTFFNCPDNTRSTCASGTLFSDTSKSCVAASTVSTATCTTMNTSPTFCTNRAAGLYAAPGCTGYWSCPSNVLTNCPTGQLYSNTVRICITASNVDTATCNTRTTTSFCSGRANGVYGDPATGCARFWNCNGGTGVQQACGTGTVFNNIQPTSGVCDWPANVNLATCTPKAAGRKLK